MAKDKENELVTLICKDCRTRLSYSEAHDAEFCRKCDTWKITKCSANFCEFCPSRPEKPSDLPKDSPVRD